MTSKRNYDAFRASAGDIDTVILTAARADFVAATAAVGPGEEQEHKGVVTYRAKAADHIVMVVGAGEPGETSAAPAAWRMIAGWKPTRLLLVGVTDAIPQVSHDLRVGDILVLDGYSIDADLLAAAHRVTPAEWIPAIGAARPDGSGARINPLVHFGQALDGNPVSAPHGLVCLVIKAIVDSTDHGEWHRYAAEAAARFAVAVLHRGPRRHDAPQPPPILPGRFPGHVKLYVIKRLTADWEDLADYFDVKPWEKRRFRPGNEPRGLWELLEVRDQLAALPDALDQLGRSDLGDHMRTQST